MQHMVLSLCNQVSGRVLLKHDLLVIQSKIYIYITILDCITSKSCFSNTRPLTCLQSDSTVCCMYTVCPTEDEHLRLETCRGT